MEKLDKNKLARTLALKFGRFKNIVFWLWWGDCPPCPPPLLATALIFFIFSLEFDRVTNASLAGQIRTEYMKSSILYDRILRSRIIPLNDSGTSFSVNINSPSKSLMGVLLIFTKERSATKFNRDTAEFYNHKITKVEVTVEGSPNELYAQNMEYHHHYDEIMKYFGEGRLKDAGAIQKDLQLHDVNITSYYIDKYALWLDFRTKDDNKLHGSGSQLENTLEGI